MRARKDTTTSAFEEGTGGTLGMCEDTRSARFGTVRPPCSKGPNDL